MNRNNVAVLGRTILVLLWLGVWASGARADGCFVWRSGADLKEPSQKAIIHWNDGTETMVLQVKYEGPAEDFAWIVPLPARPKVSAIEADKSPFAEISLYTQRRGRWGSRGEQLDKSADEKVEVLERKVVGVYDVAVLAAADAKALTEWLNNHGYAFPKDRADVLAHYTKRKWVYVAMRIDRKALATDEVKKLNTGELQPIRFTFESKELVYPLRISCVNAGPTEVLLYLLAGAPMVLKGGPGGNGFEPDHRGVHHSMPPFPDPRHMDPQYAMFRKARGGELPLTWGALGLKPDSAWHLCKYRGQYDKPAEMSDDLTFAVFDPLPYWRGQVGKLHLSYITQHVTVLAQHDERTYGPLLREVFDKLLASGNADTVARSPLAPPELLDRLAKSDAQSTRHTVAANANTPSKTLVGLLADADKDVVAEAARNPSLPVDDLLRKLKGGSVGLRESVAKAHGMRPEVLAALAGDPVMEIRARVAENRCTPASALGDLAADKAYVRRCVGANRATPPQLLGGLSHDEDREVRYYVASNPWTPEASLASLSADAEAMVREGVARNPAVPPMLLLVLAQDTDPRVCQYGGGPGTTQQVLTKLSRDDRWSVRRFVAMHAETHPAVLERLSNDGDVLVRVCVALNPATPDGTIRRLAADETQNSSVSRAAKRELANRTQTTRPAIEGKQ